MNKILSFIKAYKQVKSESMFFLQAAFYIIVACIICEIFVFNARHFITHWGDGQINMRSPECSIANMVLNERTGLFTWAGEERPEIAFFDINKRVVTVYIDAVFNNDENAKIQSFYINYGNEEHSNRTTAAFNVIRGAEESKYVTLHTFGKVSHIRLIYGDQYPTAAIRGVTLNKTVPLKFFWPRVILFSVAAFCIVLIKRKKLFTLPLRSDSIRQNILTVGIMVVFTAYLFALMLLMAPFSFKRPFKENFANESKDQYNAEIVDAILDGHAYLNIELSEEFLALENPYGLGWGLYDGKVYPPGDHVYYNGKIYSYFGIVQVLVLALPYKIITGRYIPTRVAVFIFSALASIFFMLIWRRLVFRYMKNMPLGIYSLGLLTAATCSMLSFLILRPSFYEVANSSGLFFTTLGLWLILGRSTRKKTRWIEIAAGNLCMALAVGCRPNYMFFFPLIPVVLFEDLKKVFSDKKRFIGLCACVAVPYMLVACGLMWYNYMRYGSVFEFGASYLLNDSSGKGSINPMAKLIRILIGFYSYFLPTFRVSASFPFLYLSHIETGLAFKSYFFNSPTMGLIALPVTWFIPGIGMVRKIIDKRKKPVFHLTITMICLGFLQIVSIMLLGGAVVGRYTVDFFWLFVLSGLFCACFIYEGITEYQERIIQIQRQISLNLLEMTSVIINSTMIISILLIFLLNLSGDSEGHALFFNNNPAVYYTLQRLLGFNTW